MFRLILRIRYYRLNRPGRISRTRLLREMLDLAHSVSFNNAPFSVIKRQSVETITNNIDELKDICLDLEKAFRADTSRIENKIYKQVRTQHRLDSWCKTSKGLDVDDVVTVKAVIELGNRLLAAIANGKYPGSVYSNKITARPVIQDIINVLDAFLAINLDIKDGKRHIQHSRR